MNTTESKRTFTAWIVLLLCFLTAALEGFDISSMGIAAPKLGPEFNLTKSQLGLVLSGVPLGMLLGAFVGGRMADAFGRKWGLVAAVIVVGAFQLATAFAPDYPALCVIRFACGLGLGAALPNLIALTSEAAGDRRLFNVVVVIAGMPSGGIVALNIALFGGEHGDWRTIFLIGGIAPLVLAPVLAFALRESCDFIEARAAEKRGSSAESTLITLFGRGRAPTTLWLWVAAFASAMIIYVFVSWIPVLMGMRGFSRTDSLLIALPFAISGAVGPILLAWLAERWGARGVLILCYLGLCAGLVTLSAGHGFAVAFIGVGLAGTCVQGASFILYGLMPLYYDAARRGAGTGAAVAAARVGAIAGPSMAGVLLGAGMSASQLLQSLVPIACAAALAAWFLLLRKRPAVTAAVGRD
jgi:MFS transporter, AAHS family, 3-hydroxyphenylpropionic acid transporter